MSVESDIATTLASAAVTALVGDRIYAGQAPQQTPAPYLVWQIVLSTPDEGHDPQAGAEPLEEIQVQVAAYASTFEQAGDLSAKALAAMRAGARAIHVDTQRRDSRDDQTQLFRRDFDFTLWE